MKRKKKKKAKRKVRRLKGREGIVHTLVEVGGEYPMADQIL